MRKEMVASILRTGGAIVSLVLMWQSVRFCMGKIGAPGVDYLFASIEESHTFVLIDWYTTAVHYIAGFTVWIGIGVTVGIVTDAAARIVVVGFNQFFEEQLAAEKEARRLERIQAIRERRRELRRKASESKSGIGIATLIIGIVIGFMWF